MNDESKVDTSSSDSQTERPPHALTVPAFRNLWLNNLAFFMASNAQRFVFGWFVLDGMNGTESDQGLVVFALGVPGVFLVLQAGVWADRWNRKRLLIGTQLASAAAMAAAIAVVATDNESLPILVMLSLVAGAAGAVGQPVRQALVPALVSKAQLYSAIAINAIAITLSLILGAAVARMFGNIWGFTGAFGFLLGLFAVGILALVPIVIPEHGKLPPRRTLRAEMGDAVRFVWESHALRTLFGLLMLAGSTFNPLVMVTMQAHVKEALGRDSGDTALPFALMGVGIAISSVVVMRKGNMKNKGAAFMRAMVGGTTIVALIGRTDALWQVTALALFKGMCGGFYINMNMGLIQAHTPANLMGRVMGLYTLIQVGLLPIGALFYGIIATKIGTSDTMSIFALVGLAGVLWVYFTDADLRQLS